ncbi:MAG: hypothetical protein ACK48S_12920 [Planctomycetia bacterium]|jgi:hypothetical protein
MATATKSKAAAATEPAVPITFEEINRRKVGERIAAYREIVGRRAAGEPLAVADMERAGELLDQLGLPAFAFDRDTEAMQRCRAARAKHDAAQEAAPAHRQRAEELAVEIEAVRRKLETLREEHRIAMAKSTKSAAYMHTVAQLEVEHPHVIGDLAQAVRLRIEELDRRKQIGGAA